jgi:hypothetical protein
MKVIPETYKEAMDLGQSPCTICLIQSCSWNGETHTSCEENCEIFKQWKEGKHPESNICLFCGVGSVKTRF